jgi:membrane associated rhomboid family serine protease
MATATQTCYRHPNRETGVSCSNCGRPICPDCMTPTPVGMRCPECSKQRTEVRTMRTAQNATTVTITLIAINVLAYLASGRFGFNSGSGGTLYDKGALYGPLVHDGDWWRLVTSGFLHANLIHIGFNMYLLYVLGQMLEPAYGSVRFALVYVVALLGGSFGALLVDPHAVTVGASGAVFGLMGVAFFELRARGVDPFQTGIGGLIVINLLFSFVFPGISWGGHVGGLVAGSLAALALQFGDRQRQPLVGYAATVAIGAAAVAGAFAVAGNTTGLFG